VSERGGWLKPPLWGSFGGISSDRCLGRDVVVSCCVVMFCLFFCLFLCSFLCLFVCLFVSLSVGLSVCPLLSFGN